MTAKAGAHQASWNAGEITPAALRSTMLKPYYSGALTMQRLRPVPQGGVTLMPSSRLRATLAVGDVAVKLLAYAWSRDQPYMLALRAGAIDIHHGADAGFAFSATLAAPWSEAMVREISATIYDDTILFFHPDLRPQRLRRLALDSWALDETPFTDVPTVDYGGSYATVTESWRLAVTYPTSGFTNSVRPINITVNGEQTIATDIDIMNANSAANAMLAALNALPSIKPGVTVDYEFSPAAGIRYWRINFGGANAGGEFAVTASFPTATDVAAQCTRMVKGDPGGEPIMSDARGWPSCAIFYGGRLIIAGFRSNPAALLASRVGEYFDLNIRGAAASAATLLRIDLSGGERIVRMVRARHLVIMTTEAEWHMASDAIARDTPPPMRMSSRIGARLGTPAVEQEGDLLYVNRAGTQVLIAAYSEMTQGYKPGPISLLSTHLLTGVSDLVVAKAGAATDADRLWIVNADGGVACGHLLRDQDVTGFTPWATPDPVRAVAVDASGVVWLAAARGGAMRLETLEEGLWLDSAVTVSRAASTRVAGLSHLEGRSVHAVADGWPEGPLTVTGGAITLSQPAAVVTVGLWTPARLEPLPIPRDVGQRRVLLRRARVHSVVLDLVATDEISISANGRPARVAPLMRYGAQHVDLPPQPVTARLRVTGLTGFTHDTQVTIEQSRPGPFTLQALTMEARL